MVPRDNDCGDSRPIELSKELVYDPLGVGRWCRGVEDVASDEKAINCLLTGVSEDLGQRSMVLVVAGTTAYGSADMPVAGMKEFHRSGTNFCGAYR
jgi:hypothetical protein